MRNKRALITGVKGQDGAYLSKLLLDKGYTVYGMSPHRSSNNDWRLKELIGEDYFRKMVLLSGDVLDVSSARAAIQFCMPDEVYNLAAQSFVGESFKSPASTMTTNTIGTINMLEAIRNEHPQAKFYQASTSEMFGGLYGGIYNEESEFHPRSPYAVSKLAAHWSTINYRESYNMFACCGILFNHESPLRGIEFVTRKVTDAVARIYFGKQDTLTLGNIDAQRDWGFAGDYVDAMWRMLQADQPDEYVVATHSTTTVRDMCCIAFEHVGLDYKNYVVISKDLYRPAEVDRLLGDYSKINHKLGWSPRTILTDMICNMVERDIERVGGEA